MQWKDTKNNRPPVSYVQFDIFNKILFKTEKEIYIGYLFLDNECESLYYHDIERALWQTVACDDVVEKVTHWSYIQDIIYSCEWKEFKHIKPTESKWYLLRYISLYDRHELTIYEKMSYWVGDDIRKELRTPYNENGGGTGVTYPLSESIRERVEWAQEDYCDELGKEVFVPEEGIPIFWMPISQ